MTKMAKSRRHSVEFKREAETAEQRKHKELQEEIRKLKSALAAIELENEFLRKLLAQSQGKTPEEQRDSRRGIYDTIRAIHCMTAVL